VSGGHAEVRNASAKRGSGSAFFVSRGVLELKLVEVVGHEYAVLAGDGARLTIDALRSERSQIAAVSLVQSTGTITALRALNPGTHGAVESLESTTVVNHVEVTDAAEQAVLVRQGTLTARDVKVTRLRGAPGDAVQVRDARATVEGVDATDVDGAGVGVTAVADAVVRDVHCTRCAHGALVVDRRAQVRAKGVFTRTTDSPAVVASDDAQVEAEDVDAAGEGPAVWAECAGSTRVLLKGKRPPAARITGACVEVK
jgi:hypothetical protein